MDSGPSEKCINNECIDWISSLPDTILSKILSYLPVKDAVATSILSTRWKNLFPFGVPPIKIYLNESWLSFSTRSFMDFVDKLLNQTLRDVPCVETIEFYCHNKYDNDTIVSWVSAAVRLNVVHLSLIVKPISYSKVWLSNGLNGCQTLVELKLGQYFELRIPGEFILPNLKRLTLCQLVLDDTIHELLDGCPVLDYLLFSECDLKGLDNLNIQSQLLKKLLISNCFFAMECEVEIDAPNLEVFIYNGGFVVKCVLADCKSLHTVCIEYNNVGNLLGATSFSSSVHHVAKLVKACSSTVRLCLSHCSIAALYHLRDELPVFKNLNCLALSGVESHGFESLARLLESAPSLHTLITAMAFENCIGGYARFESQLPILPVCLKLCLKKIEFWDIKGNTDEFKLIEYFLKNGRVLQEVTVYYHRCQDTVISNILRVLPKHSKTCQIILVEYDPRYSNPFCREKWVEGV